MNRLSTLAMLVAGCGIAGLLATSAESQIGPPKNTVSLQPTTPGTSQSGNANVSGTIRAAQLVGGGVGLTNVNALKLNGFSSSAFLQSIPNPLVLSGNNVDSIIHATNTTSVAEGAAAIRGTAFDDTTISYGGLFESNSVALNATGRLTAVEASSSEGTGVRAYGLYRGGYFYGGETGVYSEGGATAVLAKSFTGTAIYGESYGPVGGDFLNYATNGIGVRVVSGGSGTTFGIHVLNSGNDGAAVYGESTAWTGTGFGAQFYSHAPSGSAIYTSASSVSGDSNGGTFTTASAGNGAGVQGEAYSNSGPTVAGRFFNNSDAGRGVYTEAASSTGVTYAIHALANSPIGFAGYFDGRSQFNGNVGIGASPGERQLELNASTMSVEAAHINNSQGGGLRVDSQSGTAVWALSTAGFAGVDARHAAPTGIAIYALASGSTGVNYGVIGHTYSPTGWGLYSFGNSGASGVKAFRIDDPLDPENKYLLHYSSESPSPQNFYSGNATTDASGYAWIDLPNYFSEINENFKYQLTVLDGADSDDFTIAKVSKEISGNRFQIRTNAPNVKVSWRIEADRNDLFVRNHKPRDVVEKVGRERGTYQHPELYDLPPSRGLINAPSAEHQPTSKKG